MATRVSIAIRRAEAHRQIMQAAETIGTALDLEPPLMPLHGKDEALLTAQQLEAIGAYLWRVADALARLQAAKQPAKAGKR